jgi:hypothetical protein
MDKVHKPVTTQHLKDFKVVHKNIITAPQPFTRVNRRKTSWRGKDVLEDNFKTVLCGSKYFKSVLKRAF